MKFKSIFWTMTFIVIGCTSGEEPNATRYKREHTSSIGSSDNTATKTTLGWNEPIYSAQFGLEPNKNVDGKTLAEIVSSLDYGRDDGKTCISCHNSDEALGDYGYELELDEAAYEMESTDVISGRSWAGEDGWASRFSVNETKPKNVKAVFKAWMKGGFKD